MATPQQSLDLGLILPLPEKEPVSSCKSEVNLVAPELMTPTEPVVNFAGAFEELVHWVTAKPTKDSLLALDARWKSTAELISYAATQLQKSPSATWIVPGDGAKMLSENLPVMKLALLEAKAGIQNAEKLPFVADETDAIPRSFALASTYLQSVGWRFEEQTFAQFICAAQEKIPVLSSEIWNLKPFLEFELLEQVADEIAQVGYAETKSAVTPVTSPASISSSTPSRLSCAVSSLLRVTGLEWKSLFEDVSQIEAILRTDPAGAYSMMDHETRESYRAAIADFSVKSASTEAEVARRAVALAMPAENADVSMRAKERRTHVGYYLVDAGKAALKTEIGYQRSLFTQARDFVLRWSDLFYLTSIEVLTFAVMALLITRVHVTALGILPVILLILPAVQCAIAAVNLIVTRLLPPRKLPKLDFSKGIPSDCTTIVAVPTLLTSEEQVRLAVQALEVRFLANRDPHLHFGLVTDPPDSAQQFDEKDSLAELCARLVRKLNEKYSQEQRGTFFHFHRHRTYNEEEGVWMGWERKRGKLLDFNRLLLKQGDNFPIKTGDLSLLENVRYVITLDLDTQLPPGVGHKLVGTLAHPLNRAVISERSNTVVEGYGILQPRVDINLISTNRSRFAKLLSGDTGIDIYTRAVSDVYQDLFGEGIFTGKGIYELAAFDQVLEHRLPCNLVLSHDLIEGEYARTGLVSDVEVVDDYPSHYRAFSRRKHRWVRGDWQIMFGLMGRVRNASGQMMRNPLNHISRWKIIDNLRRSLTDGATMLALLYGWLVLPEAAGRWTLAALAILVFPTYFPLFVALVTAGKAWFRSDFWRGLWADFVLANYQMFVRITFLAHQSLIEVDAVIRSIVRMNITHKKLLQWETAADAEVAGRGSGLVDTYLKYSLVSSLALGALIYFLHPHSLPIAAPFLFLWGTSIWVADWLNHAPRQRVGVLNKEDRQMVRDAALRTWRFFREFSNADENWLIPDIVQEDPPLMAHRVSPTNLGLLLNSRLAAHDLGYLSTEEFIRDTEATLDTVKRMPKSTKSKGHLYNWYENSTLEPVAPLFVSTVDNGNLLSSLWTLKHGCMEILNQPLLRTSVWEGIRDHVNVLIEVAIQKCGRGKIVRDARNLKRRANELVSGELDRIEGLRALAIEVMALRKELSTDNCITELEWWAEELSVRLTSVLNAIENLAPWMDSRYQDVFPISGEDAKRLAEKCTLESLPQLYAELQKRLDDSSAGADGTTQELRAALEKSMQYSQGIVNRLTVLAQTSESMAAEMDFGVFYDSKKKLFSIGFDDAETGISKYHYDLLASEARTAVFCAIAKGEVPQEAWFQLKRSYRAYKGEDVLLSWSGTTFEYLMPCLWLRALPNTLLERGVRAAISAQQKFARENNVPVWGISESSCNQRNPDGHYRYHAFGVPPLALHRDDCSGDLVIAPYATFLAMQFETSQSVKNLRKMKKRGWAASYGFYEAADFTPRRAAGEDEPALVRNFMAHHQGMCLVAAANILCDQAMQRRFHAEPCVAATERLLDEKLPRAVPYEEDTETISKSAPALLNLKRKPHPGFRGLLPKLLMRSGD
ncbi:MAG TPA: glucoamylase family protein [Candidatus Acidoferrum sp.]